LGDLQAVIGGQIGFQLSTTTFTIGPNKSIATSSNKVADIGANGNFFDNVYVDRLYVDSTSVYIDVSGTNMTFTDSANAAVTLSTLVAGGNWSRSGTEITLANSGDGVRFDSNEQLRFGSSAGAYIMCPTTNYMQFFTTSTVKLLIASNIVAHTTVRGTSTASIDLGSTTVFWKDVYAQKYYVENVSTSIALSGSDMTLTSADAGTVELYSHIIGHRITYSYLTSGTTTVTPAFFKYMKVDIASDSDYAVRILYIDLDNIEAEGVDWMCHFRLKATNDYIASTASIIIRDSSNATIYSLVHSIGTAEKGLTLMWDNTNDEWTILSDYTN